MNGSVLGRYVNHNSFIHRMDPRNKILCLIALMVAIFFSFEMYESVTLFLNVYSVATACVHWLMPKSQCRHFLTHISADWLWFN